MDNVVKWSREGSWWFVPKNINSKFDQKFHLLFFSGGGKTRSFHFKYLSALLTLVFVGVIFTWSLVSFVLITNLQSQLNTADLKLRGAFSRLLELQVMQEKSFEKIAGRSQIKPPIPTFEEKEIEGPKFNAPASQLNFQNTNLMVSNIRLQRAGFSPNLKFDIQNMGQNTKTEGLLWAVVHYDSETGEHKKTFLPEGVKIDADGKLKDFKTAYKFNIRRFKSRDFHLSPDLQKENIKSVTYYISDLSGHKIESRTTDIYDETNL